MALHLDEIRIGALIGHFGYNCTQEDVSGMYLSFISWKFKVVSLPGGKFTRK